MPKSTPEDAFAGLPPLDAAYMESQEAILKGLSEPYRTIYLLGEGYRLSVQEISRRLGMSVFKTSNHIGFMGERIRARKREIENEARETARGKKLKDALSELESLREFLINPDLKTFRHIARLIEPIRRDLVYALSFFPKSICSNEDNQPADTIEGFPEVHR